MELTDTHAHLYANDFTADIEEVISRAQAEGVKKIFLPAIDSQTTEAMLALESRYQSVCIAMMGLHPCSVKADYKTELDIVQHYLQARKFVAIGEIGLDFYWDKSFMKEQYEAFHIQIEWAMHYQIPIVIHTRNAMKETIAVVKEYAPKVKGIFHCFGGTQEEANEIINAGFYLGIGGILTYKKSNLPKVLADIDLEHLVLETDAPYLTPVPFRGKRNESSYIKYIAENLALIKKVSVEKVAEITTKNANQLFE